MAITKNYVNEIFRTVLVLSALLSTASAVDCNGKSFQCVNSTHFMICVDLGGGVSQAIDNFFIACPPPTVCQGTNHFECEFPAPTTPSTTLSNVISETTLPWDDVVTDSSTGNATKEFSENYMNTERITAAVEYSITTDKAVDLTAATASEFYVNSELSIPEIVPTLAPEIASTGFETTQAVEENQNITKHVPTVVAHITTDVTKKVTQSATKRKNLTETEPVVVDDITTAVIDTTTENRIITDTKTAETDYSVSSATEQVPVNENLNISKYVPTVVADITTDIIATVKQFSAESKNLTVTEPVVVDDITTAIIDTTTENRIITDTKIAETDYSVSSVTEQVPVNENLNISKYVPTVVADITTDVIATVTQSSTESKNLTVTEPVVVDDITTAIIDTTTENIIITDTKTAETDYRVSSATEQVPVNENLNISKYVPTVVADITTDIIATVKQFSTESKNLTVTEPVVVDDITTAIIDTTTENRIITDTKIAETDYSVSSVTEQVPVNENLNISKYVPTVVADITTDVIATVTQSSTESKNLTVTEPVVVADITTAIIDTTTENIIITDTKTAETEYSVSSATEQVPVNENLNISKYVPTVVADITTDVIATVTQSLTESKNLTATEPVIVDYITTAVIETTTEYIIIADTITVETEYVGPSVREQVPQTVNENLNITEYVSTVVPVDITTDVTETVTQSAAESKNLTETEPVVNNYITTEAIETTTENSIITDTLAAEKEYVGPSVTEQVPQTIIENLNITEIVPSSVAEDITTTIIETVTQTTAGSGNITETEYLAVDKVTATIIETTTDNIIITDPLETELGHVETTAAEEVAQSTNDNLLELETVQSMTEPPQATVLLKNISVINNTLLKELSIELKNGLTIKKAISSTLNNITATNVDNVTILKTKNTTKADNVVQDNLPVQKERVNVSEPSTPSTLVEGSGRSNASIVMNNHPAAKRIDNKESQMPTINDPAFQYNSAATRNSTTTTIDKQIVGSNLSSPISHANKSQHENNYTTVANAPSDQTLIIMTNKQNPAETTVLGGIWTETGDNGAGTGQPTTINEESLATEYPRNVVTENIIIPTTQGVNLEIITTDAVPTMASTAQTMPPAFEDTRLESPLPVTKNIVSTVNNGASTNHIFDGNEFITAQAFDRDMITTDVMYMPTTDSNGQGLAFEDIMKTEAPLSVTESNISSVNNGASTNGIMTSQPVNLDILNTEAMYIPTPTSNAQPIPPTFEDNVATNVPIHASENILSLVNNGASINGLATVQAVNVDIINTEAMYIPTTISNAPSKATAFGDNVAINVPLTATENIISSLTNGASTKDLETEQAVNVNIINTELMYIPTTISDVPSTAPAFEDSVTTDVSLPTTERQRVDMRTTQTILSISTDTGVKLEAIESDVNENYHDNKMTTIDTHFMFEIGEQHLINNIPNSTVDLDIDESISHVSQTGVRNIENTLLPNAHYNQNEVMSTINRVTVNGKPTLENANEQPSIHNIVISQKESSPITVKNNIVKATTTKSIPTFSFDSAFDISNQNLMSQQGESKPKEANSSQADNIFWNPLANIVLDNGIQKSESMGTSNVTNINAEASDRIVASLNTELVSQQTTTSSVINANINDREQSINSILIQGSNGFTGLKDISATNGHAENIAKVNSEPESDYRLHSQSEVPETTDTSNLETDTLANVGTDLSSASKSLPGKTSVADTILDSIINEYIPIDNSFRHSSRSTIDKIDINTHSKSGSNAKISSDNQENINAKSNRGTPIVSISITSDKPEVKWSIIKAVNIDSSTVVHNKQLELPASTHGLSETTRVGTPTKGNKVNEEDDTISKPVMLDVLPLPINNIKFSAPTANTPVLTDLTSNTKAENTAISSVSHDYESLKHIFATTGTKDGVNVGHITTVPRIADPDINFHMGVTERTSYATTVSTIGGSTSGSQTSVFAKTVSRNGDATFNSQSRPIDGADVLLQPTHVEQIPNKKANAPNNAHLIPDAKSSGSGTNTDYSHYIHSSISSNNVNTGIVPESVSESNYKSENIMPQESVFNVVNQKGNSTVDISFNTENVINPIGGDNKQSEVTQQNNSSTNITLSISTQTQNISTSTARTPAQMVIPNPISYVNNDLNKQLPTDAALTFSCINGVRGRYSDKDDCRKFYICIGNNEPIVGNCPENTVFSDLKKLCTKNMSHCIRENQFKCPSAGRFSDFIKDNVYYICVNHKNTLYRFKFQCQTGYVLDKVTVKCIETKETESNESVSISSSDSSSRTSSNAISSSTSSTSNSSNRANDTNKNDNSMNSKKSNEAETSEKSEGKDDDEDEEVFKCKKEGKFPIDNECRRYYLCKKNRKSEYRRKVKKCNSDKVFHKDKKKCVDDDSYEC